MRDFLPGGNFATQVRNAKVMLHCMAQKSDGTWVPATLDLTHLEETNVSNHDGVLVNEDGDAGRTGFLPHGNYLATTRDHRTILSALCPERQTWRWRTMDITHLSEISTLSLIDGELKVDDHSTN